MMFRNHHQIYTHCEEFGVIIGQYWKSDSFWGRVNCITESGDVILDPMPMMYARHRISLSKLVTKGQLIIPVMLNPYKQWLTVKHIYKYWQLIVMTPIIHLANFVVTIYQ